MFSDFFIAEFDPIRMVSIFLTIYMICILIWALISWLPMLSPQLAYNDMVVTVRKFLDSVVDPYVGIFRRFIPPIGQYDVSALAAILVLIIAQKVVDGL